MVKFNRVSSYIWEWLEERIPNNLYYHGLHHTKDVFEATEKIAKLEEVSEEDLLLLQTAALWHDSGFAFRYIDNEPLAAKFARECLPLFGFSTFQVEQIANMILATAFPQKPKTKLEEILCDADLDYLGRDDFYSIAHTLRREWMAYGKETTLKEWYTQQVNFLENHRYFTASSRLLREERKQKHLREIKELLSPTN
jgi:predicted metal-dependent HD superfamily phosphohydrolase